MMFAHLDSFGYHDLYIIPCGIPDKEGRLVLTVATKDQNIEDFRDLISKKSSHLQSLVMAIEFVSTKKFPEILVNQKEEFRIDSDFLQLLRIMVQEDLKLFDAAKKMNISRHTANRWIKSANTAFRVGTTARVIYLALKAGLVDENEAGE